MYEACLFKAARCNNHVSLSTLVIEKLIQSPLELSFSTNATPSDAIMNFEHIAMHCGLM